MVTNRGLLAARKIGHPVLFRCDRQTDGLTNWMACTELA